MGRLRTWILSILAVNTIIYTGSLNYYPNRFDRLADLIGNNNSKHSKREEKHLIEVLRENRYNMYVPYLLDEKKPNQKIVLFHDGEEKAGIKVEEAKLQDLEIRIYEDSVLVDPTDKAGVVRIQYELSMFSHKKGYSRFVFPRERYLFTENGFMEEPWYCRIKRPLQILFTSMENEP